MKPEGIFSNGDLWFGQRYTEDGRTWFGATLQTSNPDDGPDYDTEETPDTFVLFSMTRFDDGTHEAFVKNHFKEYELAKRTGDARFGSQCEHGRAKQGYCPDCLRKVITKGN